MTTGNTTGLAADVIRGSSGAYSIEQHATNTFTVLGFNLGNGTYLPSVSVSPSVITAPAGQAPLTSIVSSTEIRVAKAEANLARSGYATVFVNSIPSINNLNDDTHEHNEEYNEANPRSYQWTDTRYLWVWANTQLNSGTFDNQTYYYPDMMMDPITPIQPIFSYANDNDGRTYRTTSDTARARRAGLWFQRQTSLAYADNVYWMLSVEDSFGTDGVANIGYLILNRDGNVAATNGAPSANLIEIIGEDYTSRQLNRFRYPKLKAETAGTGADIYIVYYDDHPSHRSLTYTSFRATGANASNLTQPAADDQRAAQVSVITDTAGVSSQYYDFVKVGSGIAVAYYDETNSILKLAYSSNIIGTNNLTNTATGTWETVTVDSNNFAGSHVSMVTHANKLYIAYNDGADANLKMARVSWNGSATAPTVDGVVFIDSYLSVGTWTNIEMIDRGDGTGIQPYISYYSDSYNGTKKSIRLAFPNFDATADEDEDTPGDQLLTHGVTGSGADETFSGSWEIITVPTLTTPKGGMEQFNHTQLAQYPNNGYNMPVVGWLGDRLEYAKLQPNN